MTTPGMSVQDLDDEQQEFIARFTPPKPREPPPKLDLKPKDWGPQQVAAVNARWVHLAECLAEMASLPLMTPPDKKGNSDYAPRVTVEVVRTMFGHGRFTIDEIEAWYRNDEGAIEPDPV